MSDFSAWDEVGVVVDLSHARPEQLTVIEDKSGLYRLTSDSQPGRTLDGRFFTIPQFEFLEGVLGVQLGSNRFQPTSCGLLRSRAGEYWFVHASFSVSKIWDFNIGAMKKASISVADWILDDDGEDIPEFSSSRFLILGNAADEFILPGDSPFAVHLEGGENHPIGRPMGTNWIQFCDGCTGRRRFSEERDAELIFVTLPDESQVVLAEYGREGEVVKYFLFNRSLVLHGKEKIEQHRTT